MRTATLKFLLPLRSQTKTPPLPVVFLCSQAFSLLRDQFHSMWNQMRRNVGIEHNNQAHDRAQGDRVPDDEAEDHAFVAHLVRSGGGDANRLSVYHLAH